MLYDNDKERGNRAIKARALLGVERRHKPRGRPGDESTRKMVWILTHQGHRRF